MQCCPTCGKPYQETLHDKQLKLSIHEQRLYKIFQQLRRSGSEGLSAPSLFERLYVGSDGGPDSGPAVVHVMVQNLNRKLKTVRERIVSTKGRNATYSLQKTRRKILLGERVLTYENCVQIKKEYEEKKFNQVQLAKRWGVSQGHISVVVRYGDRDNQRRALREKAK